MEQWNVQKEIRVFGLRRSGNHAIINWIIRQTSGSIFFLNNGDILDRFDNYWCYRDPPEKIDLLIHSYEVHRFSPQILEIANANRDMFFPEPEERYDVLILRDPFNFFASRLKSGYMSAGRSDRYNQVDLWLCYADEFRGRTNYLGPGKVLVNYNRWCMEELYRKSIAQELRVEFTDNGFTEVTRYGGGSSFEGLSRNNSAHNMRTGRRWQHYLDNKDYLSCFNDPRVLSASKEIFEGFEDVREIVKGSITTIQRSKALLRGLWIRYVIMQLIDLRLRVDRKHYLIE